MCCVCERETEITMVLFQVQRKNEPLAEAACPSDL